MGLGEGFQHYRHIRQLVMEELILEPPPMVRYRLEGGADRLETLGVPFRRVFPHLLQIGPLDDLIAGRLIYPEYFEGRSHF
jgi:hypothetical protein